MLSRGVRFRATPQDLARRVLSTKSVPRHHIPEAYTAPELTPLPNSYDQSAVSEDHWKEKGSWSEADLRAAQHEHVMATWGPTNAIRDAPLITHGEGIYVYDSTGKQYIDWTSQAICANLGHTVPPAVMQAVVDQFETIPHVYGGLGIVEVRCRLSKLMAEIMPGDLNGFLFPTSGAEANEAAVRIARRYTGKQKIITLYRSYHGGTSTTLAATGDFRRFFAESGMSGFVKAFNPTPLMFSWGATPEEAAATALAALEEQVWPMAPMWYVVVSIPSVPRAVPWPRC